MHAPAKKKSASRFGPTWWHALPVSCQGYRFWHRRGEWMKIPGPDHPITIEPSSKRVRVSFNGRTVADTTRAVTLREASYKPVLYVPREDADMALFERTERTTHCPYKGDASYYSLRVGDRVAENAVWSYE